MTLIVPENIFVHRYEGVNMRTIISYACNDLICFMISKVHLLQGCVTIAYSGNIFLALLAQMLIFKLFYVPILLILAYPMKVVF